MLESNAKLMHRYCLAWRTGDFATVTDFWADDVVVHIPGRNSFSGTYYGKEKALEVSVALQKWAPRYPVDIHDWLVGEEHAVVMARERAVRSGETLDVSRLYVFHLDGEKIKEIRVFHQPQSEIDEFYS